MNSKSEEIVHFYLMFLIKIPMFSFGKFYFLLAVGGMLK